MEYVYHGSSKPNLKVIKPYISTHQKEWVYACASRAISTIFLSNKGNDLYYLLSGDGVNYPVELVERKEGMFKEIFNCDGYIYKLSAINFKGGCTSWSAEYISEKEEEVLETIYVNNVYEELIQLDKEGLIKLYLYPNRPGNIPLDNSDLIPKVIRWKQRGVNIEKFYELYPELKEKFIEELIE